MDVCEGNESTYIDGSSPHTFSFFKRSLVAESNGTSLCMIQCTRFDTKRSPRSPLVHADDFRSWKMQTDRKSSCPRIDEALRQFDRPLVGHCRFICDSWMRRMRVS